MMYNNILHNLAIISSVSDYSVLLCVVFFAVVHSNMWLAWFSCPLIHIQSEKLKTTQLLCNYHTVLVCIFLTFILITLALPGVFDISSYYYNFCDWEVLLKILVTFLISYLCLWKLKPEFRKMVFQYVISMFMLHWVSKCGFPRRH